MTDNIYTYITTLPSGIHEMITPCYDGYTIYIDDRLDAESRIGAYNHAIGHIGRNDWERSDVHMIELCAHEETA